MTKSLIPLILFLSAIVLLTVFLTNTETIRSETIRGPELPFSEPTGSLKLDMSDPLNLVPSTTISTPSERLSLDKKIIDATAALASNNYEFAINTSKTILVFDPRNYTALSVLGKALYFTDQFKEAETVYTRQSQYYPNDPLVFSNLGYTQAQLKKYPQAIENLQNALRYEPRSGSILLSLAGIYAMNGEKNRALNSLQMSARRLGTDLLNAIEEPMLDNIRDEPEFKRIVNELQDRKMDKK